MKANAIGRNYLRNIANSPDKKIGKNYADTILSEKEKMPI